MIVSDDMVKRGAQAMRSSKAWPAVFAVGSAETLARACLAAVLDGEPLPEPPAAAAPWPAAQERVAAIMREG